ncbi:COX15/CtaA family protein [soil metagenome]
MTIATSRPRAVATWLLVMAGLVLAMVVIGGITRLTESGLSITQWKPVSGIIPPLSDAQWQAEFANYRRIDQYAALNAGMTLAQFKGIFFWEYLHRLLGRVVGMAFFLPLLWFAIRRQIPRGYGPRLVALLALGGLQGAFGWWMVQSGLKPGQVAVAPGWLAAHLLLALFTMAGLVWTALDLRDLARDPSARPARLTALSDAVAIALFIQLLLGALTAGLHAGHVTDQWPLMNGKVFPGVTQVGESVRQMVFADPAIVHFIHRWWAWVVLAGIILVARRAKQGGDRRASIALHAAVGTQILLGIATVMAGVPIALAALHQLVGALLVASLAWATHSVGRKV